MVRGEWRENEENRLRTSHSRDQGTAGGPRKPTVKSALSGQIKREVVWFGKRKKQRDGGARSIVEGSYLGKKKDNQKKNFLEGKRERMQENTAG